MNIVFRTDASLQMGTGHVMRCLTLADALTTQGATCQFICRAHEGNLIEFIRSKGYTAHTLLLTTETQAETGDLAHSNWLGTTQEEDIQACTNALQNLQANWLVVDHYALDARWENALAPHYKKLMVIDDLADRQHFCDLLLDQTYGRNEADYRPLVPATCTLLCGSNYALLRPEFATLRAYSLQRRAMAQPELRQLLVTMGGADKDNATGQVLQALLACHLPANCNIKVVMGATAPWLEAIQTQAQSMPWPTEVLVGVTNMAQLMADSDLAIGAAGATSWERCCLGLPTAMIILADNQRFAAGLLEKTRAVVTLSPEASLAEQINNFIRQAKNSKEYLKSLSLGSSSIADGQGCARVTKFLHQSQPNNRIIYKS